MPMNRCSTCFFLTKTSNGKWHKNHELLINSGICWHSAIVSNSNRNQEPKIASTEFIVSIKIISREKEEKKNWNINFRFVAKRRDFFYTVIKVKMNVSLQIALSVCDEFNFILSAFFLLHFHLYIPPLKNMINSKGLPCKTHRKVQRLKRKRPQRIPVKM